MLANHASQRSDVLSYGRKLFVADAMWLKEVAIAILYAAATSRGFPCVLHDFMETHKQRSFKGGDEQVFDSTPATGT